MNRHAATSSGLLVPRFKHVVEAFCKTLKIPDGIALTDELMQNVFFILVCCELRIPIQIVGPPGCSKTLSMSIALENAGSKETVFTPLMDTRYQCNPHSTDLEIKNVFKRAKKRQQKNQYKHSVVFFDEGGLPQEEEAALKVIHKPLDNKEVACVILTNNVLDAAKSNRTLLLLHTALHTVSTADTTTKERLEKRNRLEQLIIGILFDRKRTVQNLDVTAALARAFLDVNNYSQGTKKNLFNQRDIVYFLRYLKKLIAKKGNIIDAPSLLRALQRNFNGIDLASFIKLAHRFFDELKIPYISEMIEKDATISCITDAMNEELHDNEDPNVSSFRFVLVLDPTDNESSVTLLQELGLCTDVIRVGSFPEDQSSEAMNKVLSEMKQAITQGKQVLLVNSAELDACFYDVLNRYYKVTTNAFTGARQMMAQVGIGSHSCATIVHPNFKVIVHVPISKLSSVPLPYLNRFEKYQLSYAQVFEHFIQTNLADQTATWQYLQRAVLDFTQKVHTQQHQNKFLYGCIAGQTEMSLLLQAAKKTFAKKKLFIPPAHHPGSPPQPEPRSNEELHELAARQLNFHLLQLVPPAAMLLNRNIPVAYAKEHLLYQEHYNITRFLHSIVEGVMKGDTEFLPNWIIYTKTSSSLTSIRHGSHLATSWIEAVMGSKVDDVNSTGKVIQLGTFNSDYACTAELDKLKNEKVVLLIADMNTCTQSQISLVKNHYSKLAEKDKGVKRVVAIIAHYPPEMSLDITPCYDAIFSDSFDITYIDDFGISDTPMETNREIAVIDADPKVWLAKAYGLDTGMLDMKSLENGFDDTFYDAINSALNSCEKMKPERLRNASASVMEFYSQPEKRLAKVKELFVHHPSWKKQAYHHFRRIWNQHTSYELICEISRAVLAGTVVGSLLDLIQGTMKKLLHKSAGPLVEFIFEYRNYELLSAIAPKSPEEKLVKLLIKSCAVDVSISKAISPQKSTSIYAKLGQKPPSSVLLFETIMQRLSSVFDFTVLQLVDQNYVTVRTSFEKNLEAKDPLLYNAVQYINSKVPGLHDFYFKEYVRSHLLFPPVNIPDGPWMSLLLRTVNQIDIIGEDRSILKLPVIKHFFATHIRHFYSTCAALQALNPPIENTDHLQPPNLGTGKALDEIGNFSFHTLDELWNRLITVRTDKVQFQLDSNH